MVAFRSTLFLLLVVAVGGRVGAQSVPGLTGRVVDNAEILSPQAEALITTLLENHERATTNQIAVLTIRSLAGESIESYANLVFRTWALGQADANNGVLLLIAKDDRELRIEVGYGLEGDLTDAEAGRIIRNVMVPLFRAEDFEGGTLSGVNAIIGTIANSYSPPEDVGDGELPWWVALIFLFSHGLLPMFMGARALVNPPSGRYFMLVFTSFFVGAFAFMLGSAFGGDSAIYVAVMLLLAYVGGFVVLDIWMSKSPKWQDIRKQVRVAQKKGTSTKIDAGWISFSAGGSSSSGGGGGFSGGGGSSGGGGASGSW